MSLSFKDLAAQSFTLYYFTTTRVICNRHALAHKCLSSRSKWLTQFNPDGINSLEHYRCYNFFSPSTGGIIICATAQFFPTDAAAPMLLPTTKILVAANELVNSLKQPLPLFTTSASSDYLAALKNIATIFETAASSRPVSNTKIFYNRHQCNWHQFMCPIHQQKNSQHIQHQ